MANTSFTDLDAWQTGHELVLGVYAVTAKFPKSEQAGLSAQMKRTSSSVTANIAEGFGWPEPRQKEQFFLVAAGHLFELKDQLLIARDLGYTTSSAFNKLVSLANNCHNELTNIIKAQRAARTKLQNRYTK